MSTFLRYPTKGETLAIFNRDDIVYVKRRTRTRREDRDADRPYTITFVLRRGLELEHYSEVGWESKESRDAEFERVAQILMNERAGF